MVAWKRRTKQKVTLVWLCLSPTKDLIEGKFLEYVKMFEIYPNWTLNRFKFPIFGLDFENVRKRQTTNWNLDFSRQFVVNNQTIDTPDEAQATSI